VNNTTPETADTVNSTIPTSIDKATALETVENLVSDIINTVTADKPDTTTNKDDNSDKDVASNNSDTIKASISDNSDTIKAQFDNMGITTSKVDIIRLSFSGSQPWSKLTPSFRIRKSLLKAKVLRRMAKSLRPSLTISTTGPWSPT
jgi:hypothetical protein